MRKKFLIIGCFLHCMTLNLFGQSADGLTQSQTKASSGEINGKAGGTGLGSVYSPDMFTGTVNVNVPFYSYSVDGVDLGVSISYNTGGIKVDDIASDVGLGWSLNTGGSITREVKGIEDEMTYYKIDTAVGGGFGACINQQRGSWVYLSEFETNPVDMDQEPDIFHVSVGGSNFTFSLANFTLTSGNAMLRTYTDVKHGYIVDAFLKDSCIYTFMYDNPYHRIPVGVGRASDDSHILRFKITDKHGNQFFFDRGRFQLKHYNYTSFCSSTTLQGDDIYDATSSWVLAKVITYTGAEIKYDYDVTYISYPAYRDQRVKEDLGSICTPGATHHGGLAIIDNEVILNEGLARLKKITYPNGDILTANYDADGRADIVASGALRTIQISKGYDDVVKNNFTYLFKYYYSDASTSGGTVDYYTAAASTDPNNHYNYRLMLDHIDKIGTDNTTSELFYKFSYYPVTAPRLSNTTDCYGYCNNSFSSYSSVTPTSTENNALADRLSQLNITRHSGSFINSSGATINYDYGRDKTPNWGAATMGILYRVTNGMNGSVQFDYKEHTFSNPPDISSPGSYTGYYDKDDLRLLFDPTDSDPTNSWVFNHPDPDLEYLDARDGICIENITLRDGISEDNTTITWYDFLSGFKFFVGGYSWDAVAFNTNTVDEVTGKSISYTDPGVWSFSHDWATYDPEHYYWRPDRNTVPYATVKTYQSSFVNPIEYVNGFNHGYSQVDVKAYAYGGELVSHNEYEYTNLYGVGGESAGGTPEWGNCRIKLKAGCLTHNTGAKVFRKQYLGLLKNVKQYSQDGTLVGETIREFDSHRYPDSLGHFVPSSFIKCGEMQMEPINSTGYYEYFTEGNILPVKETVKKYIGSNTFTSETYYTYDPLSFDDLLSSTTTDSKGNTIKVENIYENSVYFNEWYRYFDPAWWHDEFGINSYSKYLAGQKTYSNFNLIGYTALELNPLTVYSPTYHYYDGLGNDRISETGSGFYHNGLEATTCIGNIHFDKVIAMKSNVPITYPYVIPTFVAKHYIKYDGQNNVLETGYNDDQTFGCAIWDNRIGEKVAEVANAHYTDIAYSSFEGVFDVSVPGIIDYNKGNWDFDPTYVTLSSGSDKPMTGRYYYNLDPIIEVNSINALTSGTRYLLSVWYKGDQPMIQGSAGAAYTFQNQVTVGDWTLATAYITGDGLSTLEIFSSGLTSIDELRLIPAKAAMQTYTFEPLIGISSQCNERNNITYFEYDAMGRPSLTRDINGYITSMQKHVIQGNDN